MKFGQLSYIEFYSCYLQQLLSASQLTYSLIKNVLFLVPEYEKYQNLVLLNAFNKSLMKCGNFVYCLMQYSKSYGKMTRNLLILYGYRTPQFKNFAILPTWFSYHIKQMYCCPYYGFLIPQFQKFTKPPDETFLDW